MINRRPLPSPPITASSPSNRARPRGAGGIAIISVLLTFLVTAPAPGQGLPMLPDPLRTSDLMLIADLLDLSTEQSLSLEPLHDAYLERFRLLRSREIARFQDGMLEIGVRFAADRFVIPPRDRIEDLISQYEDLLTRITAVDRTLFTSMEPLLTEPQFLRLPRVRNRRELQVYHLLASEIGGEFNPGAGVDLTGIVEGLDLTQEERHAAEAILTGYETARLARVKTLDEVIREGAIIALDTIDRMGIRDMTPEQMMGLTSQPEMIESLQVTFDEASKPFQAAAFDLSQLNLKTFRRLIAVLEADAAGALRDHFYRRAYRRAYRGLGEWPQRYEEALAIDGLPAEVAEQIGHERGRFRRQDDQIVDGVVAALEASREYRTFTRLSDEQGDPIQSEIDDSRDRREDLERLATTTLEALLGPQFITRLPGHGEPGSPPSAATSVSVTIGGGSGASTAATDSPDRADRSPSVELDLPGPIGVSDVRLYASRLRWGEAEQSVLDAMFEDYRRSYEQQRIEIAAAAAGETGAGPQVPSLERTDPVESLRHLDEAFFDDLAAVASGDTPAMLIDRFRHVRRRSVQEDLRKAATESGIDAESAVDVGAMVLRSSLTQEEVAGLGDILATYDEHATPLVSRRVEQSRRTSMRMRIWQASLAQGRDGEEMSRTMRRAWRDAMNELRATGNELVDLNRRSLEQVKLRISDAGASDLHYSYQRAAFPNVFEESESMDRVFAAALDIPDVTGRQRERVVEIAGDFRSRYLDVGDELIRARQSSRRERDRSGPPSRERIELRITIEQLEFSRREICDRARMRLRLALNDAQRSALPDLETPQDR